MKVDKTIAWDEGSLEVESFARVRSSGVLDRDEVAWCLANDIPLAYDPKQIGWVPLHCEDDLATTQAPPQQHAAYVFRPWRDADADILSEMLSEKAIWQYMPEHVDGLVSVEAARDLIALSRASEHHFVRAVEWRGSVIGQARLDFRTGQSGSAELSYWLAENHWGKGHGRAMVDAFVQDCLDGRPDLNSLVAKVHADNTASRRLLQSIGFHRHEQTGLENLWHLFVLQR